MSQLKRTDARKIVFCLLFEKSFNWDKSLEEIINSAIEARDIETDDYILATANGVIDDVEQIDEYIDRYAVGWSKERISKVDVAILRLAIYELTHDSGVPTGVAINEAVELAKEFSTDEAPAFINGILGSVAKTVGE